MRLGVDLKLKCTKCGRTIMMDRIEFEKKLKKVVENENKKYPVFVFILLTFVVILLSFVFPYLIYRLNIVQLILILIHYKIMLYK